MTTEESLALSQALTQFPETCSNHTASDGKLGECLGMRLRKTCIKEHALTTMILLNFYHISSSDSPTDVLRVVSCMVQFELRLLMQLASNTKVNFS